MTENPDFEFFVGSTVLYAEWFNQHNKADSVFHYTSPDGLLGILGKDGPTLRFSQYNSLNDTTEGIHIIEIYRCVCKELLDEGEIDSSFCNLIYDIVPIDEEIFIYDQISFNTIYKTNSPTSLADRCISKRYQKYICCFSKNRDSLPMWNYYTKGNQYEGYNIEFCFHKTETFDIQSDSGNEYHFELCSVTYLDKEKKVLIRKVVKKLYEFAQQDPQEDVFSEIKYLLSEFLKHLSLKFKQEYFQHEEEVRAILTVPEDSTQFEVKYRSNAGYIVPYIEISFPREIVRGITVGPLLNDKTALENIKRFAKDRGYIINDKDIQSSGIPIRY